MRLLCAGSGAPVLLLHGSPNCADALAPLAETLRQDFRVIVPDTPGNGASAPLGSARPAAFGRTFARLLDTLGLDRVALYGFHSGAVFAAELARQRPERVTAVVLEGYPLWTEAEAGAFDDGFLRSYEPSPDGSHLASLWSRVVDQSWYFPWHRGEGATRIDVGLDVARMHARAMELLAAGPDYREPYAAALGTGGLARLRDVQAPTLMIAAATDVLAPHLARLPDDSRATALVCADQEEAARRTRDWFRRHPPHAGVLRLPQSPERFVEVAGGALYLEAETGVRGVWLHDAGASSAQAPADASQIRLDLPGHGLSTAPWPATTTELRDMLFQALGRLEADPSVWAFRGEGMGRQVGDLLAGRQSALRAAPMVVPPVAPRWDGAHLHAAWHFSRLRTQYQPWFERGRGRRLDKPLPSPATLHQMTLDVLRAGHETLARTLRYSLPFTPPDATGGTSRSRAAARSTRGRTAAGQ